MFYITKQNNIPEQDNISEQNNTRIYLQRMGPNGPIFTNNYKEAFAFKYKYQVNQFLDIFYNQHTYNTLFIGSHGTSIEDLKHV